MQNILLSYLINFNDYVILLILLLILKVFIFIFLDFMNKVSLHILIIFKQIVYYFTFI